MRTTATPRSTLRDADNELYDHGSDLVEAAAAIRRAASAPGAARAVPAVLGCVESALQELLSASAALEQTTADAAKQNAPASPNPRVQERMHTGFENLQQALCDAERAARAARSLASRALLDPSHTGR